MLSGPFVVIDLETTGLDPVYEGIVEIAAVRLLENRITERFETLVNSGVPIAPDNEAIHGISPAMVANAPSVADAVRDFLAFVGNDPLVAHNISFDLGFLNRALATMGQPALKNDLFDSLEMAREVFPEARSHKLEAVCRLLDHPAEGFHRAAADASHLATVFPRLLALWQQKRAWYRSQFAQIEQMARRYDQLTRLTEALQAEQAEIRRVLGLYYTEHPDARLQLGGGDVLLRHTKENWEYDLAALRPHLAAWGLEDRMLKLDRARLDRWLSTGRFDDEQRAVINQARTLVGVTHRFNRAGSQENTAPGTGVAESHA